MHALSHVRSCLVSGSHTVLEGPTGSGKRTLALLAASLCNVRVIECFSPVSVAVLRAALLLAVRELISNGTRVLLLAGGLQPKHVGLVHAMIEGRLPIDLFKAEEREELRRRLADGNGRERITWQSVSRCPAQGLMSDAAPFAEHSL